MKEELLKILSAGNKDIDNQELMNYVSKRQSEEARFILENEMNNSEFLSDAVEGLSSIKDTARVKELADNINLDLIKQLGKKKPKRPKKFKPDMSLMFLAIVLIIALIVIGFVVIRKHLGL